MVNSVFPHQRGSIFGVAHTYLDDVLLKFGTDSDIVALNRSTTLAANTALTNVLIGTVVGQALAANSLIISNTTAAGDLAMYGNRGGNSEQFLFYDSSAGVFYLRPGVSAELNIGTGGSILFGSANNQITQSGSTLTLTADGVDRLTVRGTNGAVEVLARTEGSISAELRHFLISTRSLTLTSGSTVTLFRKAHITADTYIGVAGGGAETITTAIGLEVDVPVAGSDVTITNAPVAARFLGNTIIGNVLPPASGPTNTLLVASGTAPTSSPNDSITLYSSDDAAGHTIPSFYCEGSNVLATGQADSASSVRVKLRINGTVVTLLAI